MGRRRLSSIEVNKTYEYFYLDANSLRPAPVQSEYGSFMCDEISARLVRPSFGNNVSKDTNNKCVLLDRRHPSTDIAYTKRRRTNMKKSQDTHTTNNTLSRCHRIPAPNPLIYRAYLSITLTLICTYLHSI